VVIWMVEWFQLGLTIIGTIIGAVIGITVSNYLLYTFGILGFAIGVVIIISLIWGTYFFLIPFLNTPTKEENDGRN
jgi:hypothetical protein